MAGTIPVLAQRAASEEREGSSQTILLARRTRTIKRCSFDARSEGQSGCSLRAKWGKPEGPRPGKWHVSACLVGGCERCAQLGSFQPPHSKWWLAAALLVERRILVRRGGRVRNLAFLSSPWEL